MKKYFLLAFLVLATSCAQSRKGIKGKTGDWIWGAVDMCDSYPNCETADTYLIGTLNFDQNQMTFQVVKMPTDLDSISLASDETVTYRLLAKREGEGTWHKMNWYSTYENRKLGASENMNVSVGDFILLKPQVGYIEDYDYWIFERVVSKGGAAVPYGTGDRLLDIKVSYSELQK